MPRVFAPDDRHELVGAEVTALPQENIDNEVALARAAATGRPVRLDELGWGQHKPVEGPNRPAASSSAPVGDADG